MLEQINTKITYICWKLEFISMRYIERARLEDELSKLVEGRKKYKKVMEQYGWMKESSEKKRKK